MTDCFVIAKKEEAKKAFTADTLKVFFSIKKDCESLSINKASTLLGSLKVEDLKKESDKYKSFKSTIEKAKYFYKANKSTTATAEWVFTVSIQQNESNTTSFDTGNTFKIYDVAFLKQLTTNNKLVHNSGVPADAYAIQYNPIPKKCRDKICVFESKDGEKTVGSTH